MDANSKAFAAMERDWLAEPECETEEEREEREDVKTEIAERKYDAIKNGDRD